MTTAPAFEIVAGPAPLEWWADGSLRVGGTRLLLDTVVEAFLDGESAEEIAYNYGRLPIEVIYATITFYLQHRTAVDAYLGTRRTVAEALWARIEADYPQKGLRDKLLARKAQMDAEHPR